MQGLQQLQELQGTAEFAGNLQPLHLLQPL